jgi:hypothetical protein
VPKPEEAVMLMAIPINKLKEKLNPSGANLLNTQRDKPIPIKE